LCVFVCGDNEKIDILTGNEVGSNNAYSSPHIMSNTVTSGGTAPPTNPPFVFGSTQSTYTPSPFRPLDLVPAASAAEPPFAFGTMKTETNTNTFGGGSSAATQRPADRLGFCLQEP
jgi:hypothetical protein